MKKVHLFCGNDDLRPAQKYVKFKDGYFYATDSHIAGKFAACEVFEVEGMPDEFYIESGHFKTLAALKPYAVNLKDSGTFISMGKKGTFLCPFLTAEQFDNRVGRYPDIDYVLNSSNFGGCHNKVTLNPRLINRIAEALESESLTFLFDEQNNRCLNVVDCRNVTRAICVIMPIMTTEDHITMAKDMIESVRVSKLVHA